MTTDDDGNQKGDDEPAGSGDWIRAGPTFDYFEDSDGNDRTDLFEEEVCPCGASSSDRCRFAPNPVSTSDDWEDIQPIQFDDWDDAPAIGTDSQQEMVQTDERDERTEFIDEYLRGKAIDDMLGVVMTVITFLTLIHGIELDE